MRATNSRTVLSALLAAALLGLLLAVGWWAGNWQAASTDAEMRESLLQQAADLAKSINPELARKLTFTAADKGTPAFERISEQMIVGGKNTLQRGIYSMVLRDGKTFFGPENYPENDPMASPPGTVYEQPPTQLLRIFKDKHPFTEGPFTDEYGTFVSAFTPVLDPHSGDVLMVVGVDILAQDWQASLNTARREPLLITFTLMLLIACSFVAVRWRNRRMKPDTLKFKVWIVAPVAFTMLSGVVLYGTYEYRDLAEESHRDMLRDTEQAQGEWNRIITSEIQLLKSQIDHVAVNPAILKAWQDRDLRSLTALAQPALEQLKQEYKITHFYFISLDRTCFLRAQQPDRRGDLIDRSTLLAAERTGEDSWGTELGPLGTFTFRYVRPWEQYGKTIGYLELGMEIEHLIGKLTENTNIDIITAFKKEYTTRDKFEAGKKTFGFAGQWDAYPDFVVAHQTGTNIPREVARWLEHDYKVASGSSVFNAEQGEKRLACGVIHLPDAAGRHVADIIVMRDVTAMTGSAQSALLLNLCLAMAMLGYVLTLLWSITGYAERQFDAVFKQVQESEAKYRVVVEKVNDGIVILQDGIVRFSNFGFAAMLGYETAETIGMNLTSFIPPENIGMILEKYRQRMAGEKLSAVLETVLLQKNGNRISTEISGSVIQYKEKPADMVVIRDITERKKAEEEKLELERRFLHSQKLESLGVLAGGIAHDFNNLLGAIIGNLSLVSDDVTELPDVSEAVDQAMIAAERAADLTRQMLAYSGRGHFLVKELDLNKLAQENAQLLRSVVPQTITLDLQLGEDLPLILVDTSQAQQVVMNLITNASEAIGEQVGSITILTGVDSCNEIYLSRSRTEEKPEAGVFVWMEVRDTGCGMDEETQKRLFEPFFTTKFTGRGLGMSAVLGIVQGHEGALIVDSEVGKGTKMRVLLPAVQIKADNMSEDRQATLAAR